MVGVKMYGVPRDTSSFIEKVRSLGFDTIFLGGAAGEDEALIQALKEAGLDVFLVFPVFFDPSYLETHEEDFSLTQRGKKADVEWVKFVCPSHKEFLDFKVEKIRRRVAHYQPTGITLDFMRFFVFWEKVPPHGTFDTIDQGCFDSRCVEAFGQTTVLPDNLGGPSGRAAWILENRRSQWARWKTDTITAAAKRLLDAAREACPGLKTGIHVLPWGPDDFQGAITSLAGQDLRHLSQLADFLSPMCYAPMCGREPEWINRVVVSHALQACGPVIPSIQVEKAYDEPTVTDERFEKEIFSALESPSSGILLWSWASLLQSESKQKILKKVKHVFCFSQYP